ncbi:hypothetical protein MKW98_026648 [Papaver atlanticum]|uniref:Nudix hydrolase domain-containing protein n=1 Tax=Papaver atlanticum TaxID=357466 RepID=A0AAD4S092_9MAGN|nr:hypothetical protein MKW98_026648 [Papaver atlanticum]
MAGILRSSSTPKKGYPSQELLDDLCSRFVLNVPSEDLESFERMLFLVEQAHWFYEDNAVEQDSGLKSLSLREFTSLMFRSCDALRPYTAHVDDIYNDFNKYKVRVPVSGAIILDEAYERCLLVKGWKSGASWSFPRGKRNKDEEDHTCAAREVLEETGFNTSKLLKVDDFIEVTVGEQRVRLFIVVGAKDDTVFAPQTKKEISEISWHRIDDLQPTYNDVVSRGANGMKLYMVGPFLGPLKSWISKHRPHKTKKSDSSLKGTTCVWKAKLNPTVSPPTAIPEMTLTAKPPVSPETQTSELESRPGKSFRSFRMDTASVLRAMEAGWVV